MTISVVVSYSELRKTTNRQLSPVALGQFKMPTGSRSVRKQKILLDPISPS